MRKIICRLFLLALFLCVIPLEASAFYDEVDLPVPKNIKINLADDWTAEIRFDVGAVKDDYKGTLAYEVSYDSDHNFENGYSYKELYKKKGTFVISGGKEYSFRVRTVILDEYGDWDKVGPWSKVIRMTPTYAPVKLKYVSPAGTTKISLKWASMEGTGCDGFKIYRSETADGGFKLIKTIYDPHRTKWTDTGLKPGKRYYYRVRAYSSFYGLLGEKSKTLSATPKPATKALTVKPASSSSVRLTWKASGTEVKGYQIYRATKKDGDYKLIKTIKNRTTTSFVNKKLTYGKTYYYKIRAYALVNGKRLYSNFNNPKSVKVTVGIPDIKSVKLAGITKAKIQYTKVPDAVGYVIYRATSKNGTYKWIKTVKDKNVTSYTATGLKNGKTYYFKVKAYRKKNGKTIYSAYTEPVKRIMNKLGYKGESFEQKTQRIFGKNDYIPFKSSSAASKNMKTIKIKTWDINSKGKKYTRYHYLTVHKNIAPTVQQIFKEIYNGKEKFPIKDVGGYGWRGETSTSVHCEGLAIDINYNENAQFDGDTGKPLTGSLYKPGKNPYSIPRNGDVVKTFEKYGFYWGDGYYNPDYMHFTYF